jgi:hypothetical protein
MTVDLLLGLAVGFVLGLSFQTIRDVFIERR